MSSHSLNVFRIDVTSSRGWAPGTMSTTICSKVKLPWLRRWWTWIIFLSSCPDWWLWRREVQPARQEVKLSALSPKFRFISRRTLVQFSAVAVDHFSRKEEMCQTKLYLCHSALNTSLVPFHFLPNIQSQHYLVRTVIRLTCLKTPVYKKFGSHLKQGK